MTNTESSMMSDTFGISPFQGRTNFHKYSSGLHPTLSNLSPSVKESVVIVQEILDGARMNLPLMKEVTKKAQKAKADNQAGLFSD